VKELLGHKEIGMTLRYDHFAPSHKVKAVQVLQKVLDERRKLYINYPVGWFGEVWRGLTYR
jgi:hypothetical protein